MSLDGLPPDGNPADPQLALIEQARPPALVKAAALALGLTALLVLILALQNLVIVHWRGVYGYAPIGLAVLGVLAAWVALKLSRARSWSLGAAIAISIVLVAASGVWTVISLGSGVFSPLGLGVILVGIAALVLQLVAIGPFARIMGIRKKLRDTGFDMDL